MTGLGQEAKKRGRLCLFFWNLFVHLVKYNPGSAKVVRRKRVHLITWRCWVRNPGDVTPASKDLLTITVTPANQRPPWAHVCRRGWKFTNQALLQAPAWTQRGLKLLQDLCVNLILHSLSEQFWRHSLSRFTFLSHGALQPSQAVPCDVIWPLCKWLRPPETNHDTHVDTHTYTHTPHTM